MLSIELLREMGKIAGIGGISLGVFLLVITRVIKYLQSGRPNNVTRRDVFKLLKLIIVLSWTGGILGIVAYLIAPGPKPSPERDGADKYGLKVHSIKWINEYYPGGNFKGTIQYHVSNVSDYNVVDLLPDKARWFGWNIKDTFYAEIFYAKGDLDISSSLISKSERMDSDIVGKELPMTIYHWVPRIKPGIAPGDSLEYGVVIMTDSTERDAFTEQGSWTGMSSPFAADILACELVAPMGHKFQVMKYYAKDKTGVAIPNTEIPAPDTSNKSHIYWTVNNPIPGANYFLRIGISAED
ncbi:MAG: hypothetical protein HRF40_13540 [Nitrososphaera sp.]|jgi:hypothetical protein